MTHRLNPVSFPLHGSRLIEASAGTGKTWTIAALYLRLVLGHGGAEGFYRPLHPSEILVMTFTRAATRELSDRIRQRLAEAASYFREDVHQEADDFLEQLLAGYAQPQRQQAAYQLQMAADSMDSAAVFTIDAWCQRMLREHAFDSGCLFDEELLSDETDLLENAVRDYWRQQVYPLDSKDFSAISQVWEDVGALMKMVRQLMPHAAMLNVPGNPSLQEFLRETQDRQRKKLQVLKQGWDHIATEMQAWFLTQREIAPKQFNGRTLKPETVDQCLTNLRTWALDPDQHLPEGFDKIAAKLTPEALLAACNKNYRPQIPDDFARIAPLAQALQQLEPLRHALCRHAVTAIQQRLELLKSHRRQFGFSDMLERLKQALTGLHGAPLQQRIAQQYPVAMIDEFQDTSPSQYMIFDAIYQVHNNLQERGLFLIGDPKQSIYGFRGADIHSYLAARRATAGRHYLLGTNFRSTQALVTAVNHLFLHAERHTDPAFGAGAFRFRTGDDDPLPFEAVKASGKSEILLDDGQAVHALNFFVTENPELKRDEYLSFFAEHCAEHIVQRLNCAATGFHRDGHFQRLQAADIAVLVRDRNEAEAIRAALQKRRVASVYLSDQDSVLNSQEASDVLRWLRAFAYPLDTGTGRAAYATRTAGLSVPELIRLASDDEAWDLRTEQLKTLQGIWQRQGVLAAIRHFIHDLELPAKLLNQPGGERSMTNLLHLAELLESASLQLDGELALIRWLAEQIAAEDTASDEHILRLESDACLVKVITVHKSKGLQYPLVYLPFAVSTRIVTRMNRSFIDYTDAGGMRKIDLHLSEEALSAANQRRREEDLRLLYVALTRSVHTVWLGVASNQNKIHESALGYLLAGETVLPAAHLVEGLRNMQGDCREIAITINESVPGLSLLKDVVAQPTYVTLPAYTGTVEKDWTIGSFSAMTRTLAGSTGSVPLRHQDRRLLEDEEVPQQIETSPAAWHRFPRGVLPGQFLHAQLEWVGNDGFGNVVASDFDVRLAARCQRAGWSHHSDDLSGWLKAIVQTKLGSTNASLSELRAYIPEMEFWFPCEKFNTREMDTLCRDFFLPGVTREALSEKRMQGLLMGFADLVFEWEGKYWVLDYKSNQLGGNDGSYTQAALAGAMAAHRYDVQGAIYMLALHRLLRVRLGEGYVPEQHLGGALFFFLRGLGNEETRGCYCLPADNGLPERLDQLMHHE
ncbi:exodeoxyribonuclease V subunit beta [Undibacterium griseum]|uniref:RecBCD enzyme subunit RecB n=1 Tax=Undibacterium griseum TaxID=2762295 RepID=A0ABR6YLK8_9BURK|nr:exodeoxyribonuclease V subunit beta [Undibacterium griseum]MBC3884782.1 exodeoxyribonuclease V subunit beta [Undibacterium griseum]